MKESSRGALLAWIALLALSGFGCARAHHDGVRAADGDRERGRTTGDPVIADGDDVADEDEDAPPVVVAPRPGAAPAPVARPVPTPVVDEPTTGELMAELFVEYQRDGSLRCPCHVALGVYATVDECLEATARQKPKVNDCFDRSVPPELLKELRNWVRCITEIKREHNNCLEHASCDEPSSCRIDTARCRFPEASGIATAIGQCPQAITVGP